MLDNMLHLFPDSVEAVELIGQALKIAGTPVDDGDDDGRREAIQTVFRAATPAARSRVCVLAGVLAELAQSVRAFALEVKSLENDADVVTGDAVVTPDGWLVVTLGGQEIGRVPFDPHRVGGDIPLAEDILHEYVRLHAKGDLAVADFSAQLPKPGPRSVVAILRDAEATDAAETPAATPAVAQPDQRP